MLSSRSCLYNAPCIKQLYLISLNRYGKELFLVYSNVFLPYISREMSSFKCIQGKTHPDLPTLSLRLESGGWVRRQEVGQQSQPTKPHMILRQVFLTRTDANECILLTSAEIMDNFLSLSVRFVHRCICSLPHRTSPAHCLRGNCWPLFVIY